MDLIHDAIADAAGLNKTSVYVQLSLYYAILSLGGLFFYLAFAGVSYAYWYVANRDRCYPVVGLPKDPDALSAQIRHEIWIAVSNNPLMALLMLPGPFFAHRGYSRLYSDVSEYGWPYLLLSIPLYFAFTDCLIYFIHRGLHHPAIYKHCHKLHHTYQYTTPFSSHAFHAVDGFLQGCPYYIFVYLMPFHKMMFVCMFLLVNFWTISIHDEVDFGPRIGMNTTGHHTIHHVLFNYNYGQYFTFWDRICNTHRPAVQTHDWVTGRRVLK